MIKEGLSKSSIILPLFLFFMNQGSAVGAEMHLQKRQPLSLDDCIEIAIENTEDLKISLEKIDMAELKTAATFRDLFPAISLSWSETEGSDSDRSDYKGRQYGMELEHEVWPGEVPKYSYFQSIEEVNFNSANYDKVKEDLIYEVKKSFYELATAKRQLNDQIIIIKKAKDLWDLAQKEKDAGLISELEYLKVLSRYKEVESQKESKKYLIKFAKVKLRNALKLGSDIPIEIKEGELYARRPVFAGQSTAEEQKDEETLNRYIDAALSTRLEIEMEEAKLDFYRYGREVVRGKGKPKISFLSSLKKTGDAFDQDSIEYLDEWFVGGKVSFPWFGNTLEYSYDTGHSVPNRTSTYSTVNESDVVNQSAKISVLNNLSYYYDRKEAEISYKTTAEENEKQIRKIILEVSEAFYNYKNAVNKGAAATEKLKFTLKQEEIIDTMRQLGEETLSKALDTLIELQQAKTLYNQVLFEYYVSILDLNKAVGKEL
jgi:outer membrane protein TolC